MIDNYILWGCTGSVRALIRQLANAKQQTACRRDMTGVLVYLRQYSQM